MYRKKRIAVKYTQFNNRCPPLLKTHKTQTVHQTWKFHQLYLTASVMRSRCRTIAVSYVEGTDSCGQILGLS